MKNRVAPLGIMTVERRIISGEITLKGQVLHSGDTLERVAHLVVILRNMISKCV